MEGMEHTRQTGFVGLISVRLEVEFYDTFGGLGASHAQSSRIVQIAASLFFLSMGYNTKKNKGG